MSKRPNPFQIMRAKMAYKAFTGRAPTGEYTANLDRKPQAAYKLGSLVGAAYEATRDGKTERYFHEFKKAARPDLAVRADGRQLYVVGGKYHVTDHGIEDMPTLLVMNPSPRPGLRSKPAKRKSAMRPQRRRRADGRFVKAGSYKRNPSPPKARRRRRRSSLIAYKRNPSRRRAAARSPARRSVRRFRRNPIGGAGSLNIMNILSTALPIGAGAVGTEMLMGITPIPAQFKTGVMRHVTKGVYGLGAGWLLSRFVNKRMGELFALGAVTIAAHDAIKQGIVKVMPSAQFGGAGAYIPRLGYYSPGRPVGVNGYLPASRGQPGIGGAASDGFGGVGMYMRGMGGRAADGYSSPTAFGC